MSDNAQRDAEHAVRVIEICHSRQVTPLQCKIIEFYAGYGNWKDFVSGAERLLILYSCSRGNVLTISLKRVVMDIVMDGTIMD